MLTMAPAQTTGFTLQKDYTGCVTLLLSVPQPQVLHRAGQEAVLVDHIPVKTSSPTAGLLGQMPLPRKAVWKLATPCPEIQWQGAVALHLCAPCLVLLPRHRGILSWHTAVLNSLQTSVEMPVQTEIHFTLVQITALT